ncbi:hypothetical protein [Sphingopyxis alaskensis]|jgi:hypothetical protein|uniref:Uncharacterized protein n=1 Tax=Sphingopyxis alaskensis (strain DSM 13593 / LMG 18877 / RB2256) TaxID=317655 RepID=Q1GUP3_SPHAL|nr:hypothetical protein [Sphingopyxis alaskensis]ABF52629.1 conserved hypothetical protein [Sphingopyxis alaskensis RB2256]MCM3418163.1 hypothetical protein [Sphingopyxis alaskensis]
MDLKPGSRWKSAVCDAQMVVVRPPSIAGELQCGGAPVLPIDDPAPITGGVSAEFADGVAIGKRYIDEESGLEILGARAGKGSLAFNGNPLALKGAKPLPASD